MNKKLKRMLGAVLAFSALLCALLIMNTVSVFAATTYCSVSDTSTLSGDKFPTLSSTYDTESLNKVEQGDGYITYTYNITSCTSTSTYYGLSLYKIVEGTGKFSSSESYIKFTTDGTFDVTVTPTSTTKLSNLTLINGSSPSTSTNDIINSNASSGAAVSVERLSAGTYTFGRTGSNAYGGTLVIKVYKNSVDSNTYTWTVDKGNFSETISDDELSFGSAKTTSVSNTLTYSGTAYTASIPDELTSDTTGVSVGEGTQIDETTYYNYPVTVTLQDSWFTAPSGATVNVTSDGSTNISTVYYWLDTASGTSRSTASGGTIEVSNIEAYPTIYVTAPGYKGQAVSLGEGGTINVTLEAFPTTAVNSGKPELTPAVIADLYDITSVASYTNPIIKSADINGFAMSGEVNVQNGYDNSNKTATARMQASADTTFTYTPSVGGTLTINAAASGTSGTRGFSITNNDSYTFSGTTATDIKYTLTANTEYTITVTGGTANFYSLTFVPSTPYITLTKDSDTQYTASIINASTSDEISKISVIDSSDSEVAEITHIKVDSLESPTTFGFIVQFTDNGSTSYSTSDLSGFKIAVACNSGTYKAALPTKTAA